MYLAPLPVVGTDTRHALCSEGNCLIVDGTGRRIATHPFASIGTFENGLAVFERDGRTGVVDAERGIVLEGRYDRVEVHRNGLIEVAQRGIRGGGEESIVFHDRQGAPLRRFERADPDDTLDTRRWDGLPLVDVCRDDGTPCRTHVLGARAQTLAEYAQIEPIEGRGLAVASPDGRHVGLLDTRLRWRSGHDYTRIYAYANGPIVADRGDYSTVLDGDGNVLLPLRDYALIAPDRDGMLMAKLSEDDSCLYFRADGTPLEIGTGQCLPYDNDTLTLGYRIARTNNHAQVVGVDGAGLSAPLPAELTALNRRAVGIRRPSLRDDDPAMGTIRPDGSAQLPPRYRSLAAFRRDAYSVLLRDDLLLAETDDGHGVITLQGAWLVPAQYDTIVPLSPSLLAAGKDDGWQILDTEGTALGSTARLLPDRQALIDGSHGFLVRSGQLIGLLGEDGHWKVPPQYRSLQITGQGAVMVSTLDDMHRASTRLYDLARQTEHPGPALAGLVQREDGLLEGNGPDGARYLSTAQGTVIARLPCAPGAYRHCTEHDASTP